MTDNSEKKHSLFQIHLSTAVALVAVMGLFVPTFHSIATRWGVPPSLNAPGNVDTMFSLGCLGLLALTMWRMKSMTDAIRLWAGLSCAIGFLGLFVPFGKATVALGGGRPHDFMGFCGQGVPVPFVLWDKGADFPNPLVLLINPICVLAIGAVLILLANGAIWLIQSILKRREALKL